MASASASSSKLSVGLCFQRYYGLPLSRDCTFVSYCSWGHASPRFQATRRQRAAVALACMERLERTDGITERLVKEVAARRAAAAAAAAAEEEGELQEQEQELESRQRDVRGYARGRKVELLRIHAKRPVWTYLLIAANCSVLVAQKVGLLALHHFGMVSGLCQLQSAGAKISSKILGGQIWRLLTAAFLHVNIQHLLLNTYALYALGSATEMLYGRQAFLAIYISAAMGGNTASVCGNIQSTRPSVGCSGAVFGLIAAMCVHLHRNKGAIGPVARDNLKLVLSTTAVNLMGGWIMPSVDGWAHFGGCVLGGLVAGMTVPKVVLHREIVSGRVTYVEVRRGGTWDCVKAVVAAVVVMAVVLGVVRVGMWGG